MNRYIPFTLEQINALRKKYPTPFYVYDERGIRHSARLLYSYFPWNKEFKEFFPIKALPNPEVIKILKEEGCYADCSSIPELMIADGVGLKKNSIIFTSNDTSLEELSKARELNVIINLDDPNHLNYLEKVASLPEILCLRYNPGPFKRGQKIVWRNLKDDKFGMRKDQLLETYKRGLRKGIRRFGLHMMIISNDLNMKHFIDSVKLCFAIAIELKSSLGINLEFIDFGGGLGIPYHPDQKQVDISDIANKIHKIYQELIESGKLNECAIFLEAGRLITGQHGYLVSSVRHIKQSYKLFAGLDASMTALMRPGMYGSYHHISILSKNSKQMNTYDVVGSLCENNDKFAINRKLPVLEEGDIVVIHDVGAYGRGKVFDFNGKLRPAEFLLQTDGTFRMIRRAETVNDYFGTLLNWKVTNTSLIRRKG